MPVEVIGVRQHRQDDEIVVLLLDPAADLLVPILTQRLMAFVSKPTETPASSQPPASSSSPDST